MSSLDELLQTRQVIVCVGAGGVGKTTTSAALGLRAASFGKKVLVLTVDPARRLANSLGMEEMLPTETAVPTDLLDEAGITISGELWAMMLDTRRTFDKVVERYAPDSATSSRILSNPYYEQASSSLAGSQEYMAMEQLCELQERNQYDVIILDTPPSQHALDFLEAPTRLEAFFDSKVFKVVMGSSRVAGRFGAGLLKRDSVILKGMSRFVGADVFLSIMEFLQGFGSMTDGFSARAKKMRELLSSEAVAFVIMTGPDRNTINEGLLFQERLRDDAMNIGSFVVNRVRPKFVEGIPDGFRSRLASCTDDVDGVDVETLIEAVERYHVLVQSDQAGLAFLHGRLQGETEVCSVPFFEKDIHDLTALYAFQRHLAADRSP